MERTIGREDLDILPDPDLEWRSFTEETECEFVRTVEKTHENTLDCPKLNDGGRVRERLTGYRRAASFRPELWMLGRIGDEPAACLLLNLHPEDESCELAYVGVVPEHRGKGLGLKAMEKALHVLAERESPKRLWLAVDRANAPATKTYDRLGFCVYDRRVVYFSLLARARDGVGDVSEKS